MSRYQDIYGGGSGKSLRAPDLQGRAVRVVIEDVRVHQFDDGSRRLIVAFAGARKTLVVNRVNAEAIAAIAGTDDYAQWPGVAVVLYPAETMYRGQRVPCIRVRAPIDAAPATASSLAAPAPSAAPAPPPARPAAFAGTPTSAPGGVSDDDDPIPF